jgi:hypothetical protein
MGIWSTETEDMKVNLSQLLIGKWKAEGAKFCWMKDNPNISFSIPTDDTEKTDTDKNLELICSDGTVIHGYILHQVAEWCTGTHLVNWCIVCPGKQKVLDNL